MYNEPIRPVPKIKKTPVKYKRKPSMKTRKNFPREVKEKAIEYWEGLCANCRRVPPDDPHHIRARSDNGKGVLTNCLPVCRPCHIKIENDAELYQSWKEWAKKTHGYDYWMDKWDKDELKFKNLLGDD